ncbi:unnamed protein product [Spirodela intermedia]|uniref:Methyltransferase type 11 domain-containing protein n=1 Tax=Spirodela intermedia TaxID=51605 RepID=A0A7I8JW98_SPIIN|nr:unnamed protein product [Spirodela intermedia]CAA6673752.1 unnamed protein product [Spirodela intermedia]
MAELSRPAAAATELPRRCLDSRRRSSSRAFLPLLPLRSARGGRSNVGRVELAFTAEEGELERPRWSEETPLSLFVRALISSSRSIPTAEKSNVPWKAMAKEILESDVYKEMERIQDPSIVYPDYYLKPFHGYDEGNLSWLAAAEAEAATLVVAQRAVPNASVEEANDIVRGRWLDAIEQHHQRHSRNLIISDILDIGCSVGFSTRCLASRFPSARLTGVDLSPYFLSVAQFKEKQRASRSSPITWIHANGEATGLPSSSFDLVSAAFVLHECPAWATANIIKEAFRLLRPGGTLAIKDNSPKSKVIQEVSSMLFTLMKAMEPFLDEYYLLDLEGVMRDAGFVNVTSVMTDPRRRTVTATVPF